MVKIESDIFCDNCGVEITWAPLVMPGKDPLHKFHYCCQDCFQGLACKCGERMEQEERRERGSMALDNSVE